MWSQFAKIYGTSGCTVVEVGLSSVDLYLRLIDFEVMLRSLKINYLSCTSVKAVPI